MIRESIVGPDGGEVVRLGPATVRILEDGSTTGHRLGIGEITVAPRSAGPPQHRHARHDEGFYVVSGTARFTIGAETYDAPAGTLAMIPPGTPHLPVNRGDVTAIAVVARTDPAETESRVVMELPRHLADLLSLPIAVQE